MNVPAQGIVKPTPPGRGWWRASAALHALCGVIFAGGVWAAIHWLFRMNSDAYYEAHKNAADFMLFVQAFAVGLAAMCALLVGCAVIGLVLTLRGHKSGAVMLIFGAVLAVFVGSTACSEMKGLDALASLLFLAILGVAGAGLIVASMALGHPQRPPRPKPEDLVRRARYAAAAPPYQGPPPPYQGPRTPYQGPPPPYPGGPPNAG